MPNVGYSHQIEIPDGEQYNVYAATNERYPIGTIGILQDGRAYRFAKAGGATLVVGNVLAAQVPLANHVDLTCAATALGATSTTVTLGATAVTKDQYKDGWASISVAPGSGQMYLIGAHAAVDSSGSFTIPFAAGNVIRGAALTTTSRLDLIPNPYKAVIQAPVTTITSAPVGVAVSAPTAGQHCWVQVLGAASVLTSGTLVVGNRAVSPAGAAGACGPETAVAANSKIEITIGRVLRVAATTAWSTIDLDIGN